MAKGDRIIAISDFIAQHIAENYRVDPTRIITIPRGLDIEKFNRAKVTEERMIRLLQAWRVPDHLPVLLMPARLSRIKGHSVLIEALALRRHKNSAHDIYTVIVGATDKDEAYRRELETLIEAKGLAGLVRIVDHCDDMPAAYGLATMVVAPSIIPEGFGRVPVEAQAMGKPVIASAIGGFLETILPGETGLLVPPGDAAALAEAIESLLELSEDQRLAIGIHAEETIAAKFTKQAMCEATLGVYRDLTP
jgi:glycosyltransferase involved in cell wall biosynthesis